MNFIFAFYCRTATLPNRNTATPPNRNTPFNCSTATLPNCSTFFRLALCTFYHPSHALRLTPFAFSSCSLLLAFCSLRFAFSTSAPQRFLSLCAYRFAFFPSRLTPCASRPHFILVLYSCFYLQHCRPIFSLFASCPFSFLMLNCCTI